jgi:hypothetical protein
MSREVVAILYCHNSLISLVGLDFQRKPLMRTDVKRHEIWEWSDHTRLGPGLCLVMVSMSDFLLPATSMCCNGKNILCPFEGDPVEVKKSFLAEQHADIWGIDDADRNHLR